jgi:antitoxin (DNA-binding transcriptional repressor) of toxin-antitoxin stability system
MQEVGEFEVKNTLGALLDRVERGEEILITRHGKPIARLIPSSGGINRKQARQAAQRIRARAGRVKLEAFDWESIKADRDYGRP